MPTEISKLQKENLNLEKENEQLLKKIEKLESEKRKIHLDVREDNLKLREQFMSVKEIMQSIELSLKKLKHKTSISSTEYEELCNELKTLQTRKKNLKSMLNKKINISEQTTPADRKPSGG